MSVGLLDTLKKWGETQTFGVPENSCAECGQPARGDEEYCPECGGTLTSTDDVPVYDWEPPY